MKESYLLKYSESKAEIFTQGIARFHLWLVKVSAPEPSPITSYSESPKMTRFFLLGFSSMKPKSLTAEVVAVFRFAQCLLLGWIGYHVRVCTLIQIY